MAKRFEFHPSQISTWKREFPENTENAFASKNKNDETDNQIDNLYQTIGQLEMENDFLKKVICRSNRKTATEHGEQKSIN